MEYQSDTVKHR